MQQLIIHWQIGPHLHRGLDKFGTSFVNFFTFIIKFQCVYLKTIEAAN